MSETKAETTNFPRALICPVCTHPIKVPDGHQSILVCERCGYKHKKLKPKSAYLSVAFALTALIFWFPANIFPFMTIELYGNRNSSTIWGGIQELNNSGSWPIALIVLLASLVIPFVKLVVLLYLAATARRHRHSRFKTKLYHVVEAIGRWSMLDIFLLAVLVAIMKLGPWTSVEPGLGALMFAFVVIFTMLSSAYFDPLLLWKNDDEN